MQTRNVLFLLFIAAMAAACADIDLSGHDGEVKKSREVTGAERQRVASRQLVKPAEGLSLTLASDMATALDLPAGMVTDAQLTSPHPDAALVQPYFGVIKPRRGDSLVLLSTGRINVSHLPEPGTDFSPDGVEGDAVTLRITLNVPAGANRLSFEYNFLSAESPDYLGSKFNDMFTARVTDALGTRVAASASVNSSFFFDVSATRAGGTGFDLLFSDDPAGADTFPSSAPPGIPLFPDAGITDFKTVNAEVASGGLITLEFDIRDLGDGALDSTVIIDNIAFSGIEVVDPNPSLIHPFLGTVETDPVKLAANGEPVQGVAADGITQLLLRVKVPGPGQMQLSLPGASFPANGGLGAVGSPARSGSVTVDVRQAAQGQYYAFALYTSPEDFDTGGFAEATKRSARIEAQYIPSGGGGFQIEHDITIVRPPVVVVHDLWSGCLYWKGSADIYRNGLFEVTCADYASSNSASLGSGENQGVVPNAVYEALEEMRGRGIAVTQVDAIAHGMGGLLTRKFADWSNYRRFSNFHAGDLNRLITMNTPHLGTRMADEIVVMRDYLKANKPDQWLRMKNSLARVGIVIDGEGAGAVAIDDLKTDSAVISSIGETQVPSHALVSRGGLALARSASNPMLLGNIRTLYTQMEFNHPLVSDAPLVEKQKLILGPESKLFCSDEHDLFVAEAEQKGGISEAAVSYFSLNSSAYDTEHFKVPSDDPHHTKLVELLNSPISGGLFAPSIPRPGDVPRVNSCDGGAIRSAGGITSVASLSSGSLTISSPSAGTPVAPGSRVTVALEATGGFQPAVVFIAGAGQAVFLETAPFVAEFPIPAEAIGTVELVAFGFDAQGELLASESVALPVVSSAQLTSIEVLNGDATLPGPGTKRQLQVLGHHDDGITRDISSPSLGTVYSSSNSSVATVTSGGMLTATGAGIATVMVRNGTTFTSITVAVGDNSFGHCIEVRLGDFNLFILEDYNQGQAVEGRLAAGGNISLQDFSVGWMLPDTDIDNVLVAGGDITLSRGGVWGDVWYGGQLADESVGFVRGTVSQGTPIDFAARGSSLRALSSELGALPANGSTTRESWGVVLLRGTSAEVNVFDVDGSAFTGAWLLSIEAPAGSLAVINVRGSSVTLTNLNQSFGGGIDEHGVLFNFPDATSLSASGYGFLGTVLAPQAHVLFNDGRWEGGFYARSLTGNAGGYFKPLRDTNICQ
ncbi:MAG: choice-of-anchor A family protein [Myxococcaceae bacterium]|nr:choice-of-anchor A family protein [Myxococcaceae bacterium]